MEEMAEVFLRAIGEVISWFLWDIIFQIILFNIGRLTLLLVTLGHYPKGRSLERDADKISGVGILVVFLAWIIIALYNNYATGSLTF
jgi:hypothetical protein